MISEVVSYQPAIDLDDFGLADESRLANMTQEFDKDRRVPGYTYVASNVFKHLLIDQGHPCAC